MDTKRGLDYIHSFAPAYPPDQVHPAPHIISGALNDSGYSSGIIYSNIEAMDYLIKKNGGYELVARMRQPVQTVSDFRDYVKAKRSIRAILEAESAKNGNEYFSYVHNQVYYRSKYDTKSIEGLVQAAKDPESSIFYDYIQESLMPRILEDKPLLIGSTLTNSKQAAFAMALAGIVNAQYKSELPDTKFVVGGFLPTVNKENFISSVPLSQAYLDFFNLIPYVIHNEGEQAIVELMEHVKGRRGISEVSQLIYLQGNRAVGTSLDANGLIIPSKMGFDRQNRKIDFHYSYPKEIADLLYLPQDSKEISLLIDRGCPFSCNWCSIDKGYNGMAIHVDNLKRKAMGLKVVDDSRIIRFCRIDEVAREVGKIAAQNKIAVMSLSDERADAKKLLELSGALKAQGLNLASSAYSTVDMEYLDPAVCKKLSENGVKFLQFGVETLSRNSLKASNKGQNIPTIDAQGKIFSNLFKAGVMPHIFLMIRLPAQRNSDLLASLAFIEKNSENILTIKPTIFKVSKGSRDSVLPGESGLKLKTGTSGDFGANIQYSRSNGLISGNQADAWKNLLDSWISLYHIYNPVTRELGPTERLAAGMDNVVKIARELKKDGDYAYRILDSAHEERNGYAPKALHANAIRNLKRDMGRAVHACIEEFSDEASTPELGKKGSKQRAEAIAKLVAASILSGNFDTTNALLKKKFQNNSERSKIVKMAEALVPASAQSLTEEKRIMHAFPLLVQSGESFLTEMQKEQPAKKEKGPLHLFETLGKYRTKLAVAASFIVMSTLGVNVGLKAREQERQEMVKSISSYMDKNIKNVMPTIAIMDYVRGKNDVALSDMGYDEVKKISEFISLDTNMASWEENRFRHEYDHGPTVGYWNSMQTSDLLKDYAQMKEYRSEFLKNDSLERMDYELKKVYGDMAKSDQYIARYVHATGKNPNELPPEKLSLGDLYRVSEVFDMDCDNIMRQVNYNKPAFKNMINSTNDWMVAHRSDLAQLKEFVVKQNELLAKGHIVAQLNSQTAISQNSIDSKQLSISHSEASLQIQKSAQKTRNKIDLAANNSSIASKQAQSGRNARANISRV